MLIVDNTGKKFSKEEIPRGTVIYAKHGTWDKGETGIVTSVTEEMLRVQYFPEIGNVLNHFFIPVSEVEAGQWNIRYSNDDLLSVKTYPEGENTDGSE